MAVSTSSYFSNSIVGVPQVAGELVDLYESRSTPRFALGTKFERQDGAVFRYGYFAQACTAGQLVASASTDITSNVAVGVLVAPSSTYQMPNETPGVYPGAIGSRYLVTTLTTVANQYNGAVLTIAAGTGVGYTYRIKGNTVTGTPASGKARLELYDAIVVAVDTTTSVAIAGNLYNNLAIASSTFPEVAGVPVKTQAVGYFGWVQTQGLAGVLQDAGASGGSAGQLAALSTATAGLVAPGATIVTGGTNLNVSYPLIGTYVTSGTGSTQAIIKLQLE